MPTFTITLTRTTVECYTFNEVEAPTAEAAIAVAQREEIMESEWRDGQLSQVVEGRATKTEMVSRSYGSTRITQEVIRSGQPRAYADTERVVRLYFERVPYQGTDWVPDEAYPETFVRRAAKALVGWTYDRDDPARAGFSEHFSTYLDYLRPVAPGVWELRVVTPFTD